MMHVAVLSIAGHCDTGHPIYGHFRGPVTFIPVAERLAVELSLPVSLSGLSRPGLEHLTFDTQTNAL